MAFALFSAFIDAAPTPARHIPEDRAFDLYLSPWQSISAPRAAVSCPHDGANLVSSLKPFFALHLLFSAILAFQFVYIIVYMDI